jgi:hypothetical protein
MGKKTKRNRSKQSSERAAGDGRPAPALRSTKEEDVETRDNLKFEDPYIEEYEEEEEWEDEEDDNDNILSTKTNTKKSTTAEKAVLSIVVVVVHLAYAIAADNVVAFP